MAEYTLHQKVQKLVHFLMGMRHSEPYELLVDFGWTAEQLDRGWNLAGQAGRARSTTERLPAADRTNAQLLEFKKLWFPVTRLVLGKKNPRIAALLVGYYYPRSQASAGYAIEHFLSFLVQLEGSSDDQERAARELLRERGLTAEVVAAAVQLVKQLRQPLPCTKSSAALLEAEAQAEAELWDFYREWSGLARRLITNRNLLRALGLNKAGRPSRAQEEGALKKTMTLKKDSKNIRDARSALTGPAALPALTAASGSASVSELSKAS